MNLLHLQYFYVVAKEQGFTNASKSLRIQQPAISRMVKQLEDSFGFPLFERIGRNVQLTPRGQEVFERSKRIFEEVEGLKYSVGQLNGEIKGPLHIAASEPIASHFVPTVLENVLSEFPKIHPFVYSGPTAILLERIAKGELEFGLFFHLPALSPKLKMSVLRKVRFHLVVRKDLRKKPSVLESFIGSREIDDVGTQVFPTLEKLKKIQPKASIRISSNTLTAHRSMVLKGLGVSVLPDFLIGEDLKTGALADVLPGEKLEFDLKLIQRENGVLSINSQTFLKNCDKIKAVT